MYGWDTLVLLKHLLEQGLSKTAIAERLGVSRRVVYHWIQTGQLDRDADAPPRARASRAAGPTKLDPYKPIITARLDDYPELSRRAAVRRVPRGGLRRRLTQLKAYVRQVRPRPAPRAGACASRRRRATRRRSTSPTLRFPWGKRYALLVVLGYSRLLWLQFYPRQTMRVADARPRGRLRRTSAACRASCSSIR